MAPQIPLSEYDSDSDSDMTPVVFKTHNLSPQQRTSILRECQIKITELENNINANTPKYLEPILDETDRISQDGTIEEKVEHIEEIILDSQIIRSAAIIIKKCSENLLKNFSNYDSTEFAEKVLQYIKRMPDTVGEENVDWSLLGRKILCHFNKTAKFNMFLGTLRPIAKKEVVRRKTTREAQGPMKRPEKVITLEKVEDSVEETVNAIKNIIKHNNKHGHRLDFFSLVLHPTSYGKTIENILHTSFLIRDGFVKFTIDEDGIPYVQKCPTDKDNETNPKKSEKNNNKRNIQNVLSLNMHQWKALVEAYGITKPMIDLDSKKSKNSK